MKKIENLSDEEKKELIDKAATTFLEVEKERRERKKTIIANPTYINWLISFTNDIGTFNDNDWLYCPEKISEEDKKNVDDLGIFYEAIEEYADCNYIYPTLCQFGNYYKIRLNEIGLEIGILNGQGTMFFANRVNIDKEDDYIDFNNIMNNIPNNKNKHYDQILDSLYNMVIESGRVGIPVPFITNKLKQAIETLKANEKEFYEQTTR